MPGDEIYIIKLAAWVLRALGEGATFVANLDTDAFGTRLPETVINHPNVQALKQSTGAAGPILIGTSQQLESAVAGGDVALVLAAAIKAASDLQQFYAALDQLVTEIRNQINPANLPDPNERASAQTFALTLARQIADYLIITALETSRPRLTLLLKLLGLIEWTQIPAAPGDPLSQPHVRKAIKLNAFKALITEPGQHLIDSLGWGSADFDPTEFFQIIASFYSEEDTVEIGIIERDPFIKRGIFLLRRDSAQIPPGLTLDVIATLEQALKARIETSKEWGVGVDTSLRFTGGVSATIKPPLSVSVKPTTGDVSGQFRLFANRNEAARPFTIVGGNSLVTTSAEDVSIGLGLNVVVDAIGGRASVDPLIFSDIKGVTLQLGTKDGDSFISTLLGAADIKGQFDLGLEWTASAGLRIRASGGIEIALPIHMQLGPIEFQTVYLILRIQPDGTLSLETSTAFKASLGPLTAVVDRIGAQFDIQFVDDNNGAFGPFNLSLKFKPPNGVGLAIDAGVIRGGGFLFIDPDRGEYAGALELTFSEIVSLKAIGLINTRMPDGSKGFSLLIIITADFGAGFQLGFGFTLLAVGGLLGLNRTMKLQPLMDGIRTGAIESIMFPQDVIANAPKIISDLRIIFPPLEGKFLIGPMAKLGWGTPTLISISLGIIIEIPGNIAILGILKIAIPADKIALIILQVNFAGAIEFDRKRMYFFAALFESRIVFLTIDGEMGLLVAFGDDANFVVSVGGFHPRFSPPPLPFPSPRRIAVSLLNTPVSRVRIEGYFAVTSNTVQFGARVEIFFGLDEINVQGHLAFDALFQFSPFLFIIEISASFSVNVFGIGLFSVRVRGSLDGPAPYHIKGHGSISFFFFDVDVDFETTWGESRNTELPPIAVMPILEGEINKPDNWRALLPVANNLLVSVRKMPAAEAALILHPLGVLRISQRALPLELKVDKVGTQKPNDVNRLSVAITGGGLAKKDDAFEQFAPAQFQNFSDSDKLSRPAFAPEKSGLNLSAAGADIRSSAMVKRIVRYEEIIIDNNFKRFRRRFSGYFGALFNHFLAGNAVSRSELSQATKRRLQPFAEKIEVKEETYTVAFQSNNKAFAADSVSFHSEASARDYLNRKIADDASLTEEIHVIPSFEKAA